MRLDDASPHPYWLDRPRPVEAPPLDGEVETDLARHRIDAAWLQTGVLSVATRPHELAELGEDAALLRRYGWDAEVLDRDATRAEVASPTYLGAVHQRTGVALVDPGALALGLRRAHRDLRTPHGQVRAERVLLATGAYPPLTRAIRRLVAPVYDYVLVTEPLSAEQRWAVIQATRRALARADDRGGRRGPCLRLLDGLGLGIDS